MKTIEMTKKNVDGVVVTKKIDENLAPTYVLVGWEIKKKPKKGEEYKSNIEEK